VPPLSKRLIVSGTLVQRGRRNFRAICSPVRRGCEYRLATSIGSSGQGLAEYILMWRYQDYCQVNRISFALTMMCIYAIHVVKASTFIEKSREIGRILMNGFVVNSGKVFLLSENKI